MNLHGIAKVSKATVLKQASVKDVAEMPGYTDTTTISANKKQETGLFWEDRKGHVNAHQAGPEPRTPSAVRSAPRAVMNATELRSTSAWYAPKDG